MRAITDKFYTLPPMQYDPKVSDSMLSIDRCYTNIEASPWEIEPRRVERPKGHGTHASHSSTLSYPRIPFFRSQPHNMDKSRTNSESTVAVVSHKNLVLPEDRHQASTILATDPDANVHRHTITNPNLRPLLGHHDLASNMFSVTTRSTAGHSNGTQGNTNT